MRRSNFEQLRKIINLPGVSDVILAQFQSQYLQTFQNLIIVTPRIYMNTTGAPPLFEYLMISHRFQIIWCHAKCSAASPIKVARSAFYCLMGSRCKLNLSGDVDNHL